MSVGTSSHLETDSSRRAFGGVPPPDAAARHPRLRSNDAPGTGDLRREDADSAIPHLPRTLVPRHRFWTQLDRAAAQAVTVVIAPAGAGKSLGTIGWLRRDGREPDELWIHADSTWGRERLRALLDVAVRPDGPTRIVVDDAHLLPSESFRLLDERLTHHPDSLRMLLLSRWDLPLASLVPELLGHYSALRGDVLRTDEEETATLVRTHAPTAEPSAVEMIESPRVWWRL